MQANRKVNNDIYRNMGHAWWDDSAGAFSSIRFTVNPVRFGYFRRVLNQERMLECGKRKFLDVGCGGGYLAEEFARAGFEVTGVDPAPETIETARSHASTSKLNIDYRIGSGEQLPFADESFDHVACCDVLEHVDDVDRVIGEIARVLRPGRAVLLRHRESDLQEQDRRHQGDAGLAVHGHRPRFERAHLGEVHQTCGVGDVSRASRLRPARDARNLAPGQSHRRVAEPPAARSRSDQL